MKDIVCFFIELWREVITGLTDRTDQFLPRLMKPFKSDCWICSAGRSGLFFLGLGLTAGSYGALWIPGLTLMAIAMLLACIEFIGCK